MTETKKASKKASKKAPRPEVEEVEGRTVIAFDEGSFTRAERRELQLKYNRHFDDLLLYVDVGLVRRDVSFERDPEEPTRIMTVLPPAAPEVIHDLAGIPAYADDVLIAMLVVVAKRYNPGASEAMFEDYTTRDLLLSIREGKAQARTAGKSQT